MRDSMIMRMVVLLMPTVAVSQVPKIVLVWDAWDVLGVCFVRVDFICWLYCDRWVDLDNK